MKPLEFRLRSDVNSVLDLSPLTPQRLAAKSPAEIGRIKLDLGPRRIACEKVFEMSGEDSAELVFHGLTAGCNRLGEGMSRGSIVAHGEVGVELGARMRGGQLELKGNAGNGVGLGMRGGFIRVRGDVGDRAGSIYPGETRGMNDGVLLIHGNCGQALGERMRRGLIVVLGDAGDDLAARMIAGTIAVFGECGARPGAGMRRGTLMLASLPGGPGRTFAAGGHYSPGFLKLMQSHLSDFDRHLGRRFKIFEQVERYSGDQAFGALGEILVASSS